jgi:iron complex outermembrane receptor protein
VYGAVPGPLTPFSDGEVENRYLGLYAQDQVDLGRVKVLAGARYSRVDQHEINRIASTDRSRTTGSVSPRAGVVVAARPELSLYASYSRSTRAETLVVVQGNRLPDPAIGAQLEGGLKTSLFGGRFLGTLSAYRLVKENVPVADPSDSFGPQLQVGEQRVTGVELDAAGEPMPGLRVLVSAGVARGEVTKDTTIPAGTKLLNVPDRSFTLWATYEHPRGRLAGVGAGGGVFHTGERAANATASFFLPAYTLVDATIFYQRGRHRFAVNGRNLGNARYFESGGGFIAAYPGQPRAVFTSMGVRF